MKTLVEHKRRLDEAEEARRGLQARTPGNGGDIRRAIACG